MVWWYDIVDRLGHEMKLTTANFTRNCAHIISSIKTLIKIIKLTCNNDNDGEEKEKVHFLRKRSMTLLAAPLPPDILNYSESVGEIIN
jgi:hypothetical protein